MLELEHMYAWALAVIAIGLVVGVVAYSVLAVTAEVESRVLAIGFLAFFVASLVAGAGILPIPSIDESLSSAENTYVLKTKGDSR